jgi:hypothetical protein
MEFHWGDPTQIFMFFQEWPNCMGKSWNIISRKESWGHVESHFCKPLENPGNMAPSHHIHPNHRHI